MVKNCKFSLKVNRRERLRYVTTFVLLVLCTEFGHIPNVDSAHAKTAVRNFDTAVVVDIPTEATVFQGQDFIQMHHQDRVPNFAKNYTVISIKSGKWSDPLIWNTGELPSRGATVIIDSKHAVEYNLVSGAPLKTVGVSGQLIFSTHQSTQLAVTNLLVYPSGSLEVGSRAGPISRSVMATIIINDQVINTDSPEEENYDPSQYGNGLLVWGKLTAFGADKGLPFARLAKGVDKHHDQLTLSVPPNWAVGDQLLLPDSRQATVASGVYSQEGVTTNEKNSAYKAAEQLEVIAIKGIKENALLLVHPTAFGHLGLLAIDDSLDSKGFLPHVANVTRNVIIRSANPQGVRGHTVAFHGSQINIQNALFQDLGRTTIATIDNTRFDALGNVTHVGQNQTARYPVHMHHANNPEEISGDRATFIVRRNVIAGAKRWSMSIHSSHFGLIEENIAYDVDGAGFVTEDGSETGNRFVRNFVAGVHGSGLEPDARQRGQGVGHEGSGFWLGSDNNQVIGNVVAGVRAAGYALFRTEKSVAIPPFPKIDSNGDFLAPRMFSFVDNEVYSAGQMGVRIWSTKECAICRSETAVMQDTRVWKSANGVMFDYHSDYYVFDGLEVVSEKVKNSVGIMANHAKTAVVRRAKIVNVDVGIEAGGLRNKSFKISDSYVVAVTGMNILTPTSWGRTQSVIVDNVKFESFGIGQDQNHIEFGASNYGERQEKISLKRPVYIYSHQQEKGVDYQLFKFQQSPEHPLVFNVDKALGCPVAGLTNSECFKRHKISFGGEMATCSVIIPGIAGFACPIKSGV